MKIIIILILVLLSSPIFADSIPGILDIEYKTGYYQAEDDIKFIEFDMKYGFSYKYIESYLLFGFNLKDNTFIPTFDRFGSLMNEDISNTFNYYQGVEVIINRIFFCQYEYYFINKTKKISVGFRFRID